MLTKILKYVTKSLRKDTIIVDGKPYLTRYYLFGNDWFFNIYIHCFHSSDREDELHNHPWKWSRSLILSGSYIEFKSKGHNGLVKSRVLDPGNINVINNTEFHRVSLFSEEVWTLFFAGKRDKEWGFLDVETREYKDWRTRSTAIA